MTVRFNPFVSQEAQSGMNYFSRSCVIKIKKMTNVLSGKIANTYVPEGVIIYVSDSGLLFNAGDQSPSQIFCI